MKSRLGRFFIRREIIDDAVRGAAPEAAARWCAIFGKCIVIEAQQRWDRDAIEYLAWCADFDENPEGCEAVRYEVEVTSRTEVLAGQRVETFDAIFRKAA